MTEDADPESEITQLRKDLWVARDAAIGATAELGTARAKIVELDHLIHQLRYELELREREADIAVRLTRLVARPVRAFRRLTDQADKSA